MAETAAIYLAHLNPMTNAHETIIAKLKSEGYHVYVFPVRFLLDGREVNTRSFPFSYDLRKQMVESIFGGTVTVLPDYAFYAPYSKYLPPLLSSRSWELRAKLVAQVSEKRFVSYTGDAAERLMLKVYRLNPLKASRQEISASSVKDLLYRQVLEGAKDAWQDKVPATVAEIIRKNWEIVEKFARLDDGTKRVMGMKFPREGYN
jgi:citrate lyase synthetase